MSAVPENSSGLSAADTDSQETREWMDALSAVIQSEGPERAHFLLEQLLEHARESSIDMPFSANTGYVNTIEADQEERCPGNIEIEERLRAYMRWNAMAMVVKANRHHPVDGGDLARRTGRPDRSPRPFTVFHSPTSAMKGTEALERAAAEAGVATDVVRGVPWTVALARKRTADAVFDQLALGYGLAGLEAMAMGVPVVSGASDPDGVMRGVGVPGGGHLTEALAAMFGYLPYLSATPGTLADRLREIATDGTLRDRVRDLGLYHAWRWHRPQAVAEQLARVYERAIEAKR